jgi:hypothetical protein
VRLPAREPMRQLGRHLEVVKDILSASRLWTVMSYVVPLLIPVVFVLVAARCALALFSGSPTVRRLAYRAVYGSCIGALILVGVIAWFFYVRTT